MEKNEPLAIEFLCGSQMNKDPEPVEIPATVNEQPVFVIDASNGNSPDTGADRLQGPFHILGVAKHQGSVRSERAWNWLGRHSACVFHAGIYRRLWKTCEDGF